MELNKLTKTDLIEGFGSQNDENCDKLDSEFAKDVGQREVRVVLTRCSSAEVLSRSASTERMVGDIGLFPGQRCRGLSDSDSDMSCVTVASKASGTSRRKRLRGREESVERDSDESSPKVTPSRGRGRPPTTGEYVGLAKAKAELNAAKEEQIRLQAEEEFLKDLQEKRQVNKAILKGCRNDEMPTDGRESPDLRKKVLENLDTIERVAKTSGNLKGTFVRALKEAAESIKDSFETLRARTMSDEVARLEAANAKLARELEALRQEMAALRTAGVHSTSTVPQVLSTLPAKEPAMADIMRSVMLEVGTMISARFEGLEERLLPEKRLRPPLAADRRRKEEEAAAAPQLEAVPSAPIANVPKKAKANKAKKMATKTTPPAGLANFAARPAVSKTAPVPPVAPVPLATPAPMAFSAPPAPTSEQWTEVVKRGARAKNRKAQPAPRSAPPVRSAATPKTKKAVKLRPPRSAAVAITLLPDAQQKGITYASVLSEAKGKVDLVALGVPPLSMRATASGARILEISGPDKSEKADSLANKLREVFLGMDEVRVSRPEMTADMRVTGLDDSVTAPEPTAALARAGECGPLAIKAGNIKKGVAGMGTVFVRCPITAAKKIVASGRLLVGWVAAQVRILEARPRRCFRCLVPGHVRAQCTSEVDRSDDCHRCGAKGHKAGECSADPHCSLCAAAGKTADHLCGGKACAKSPNKTGVRRNGAATKARSQPIRPTSGQVETMDEN